jgi:phosphoribosylaminoimidazole (AIR) synthetase
MFRTFNMGVGMVAIVAAGNEGAALAAAPAGAFVLGRVVEGSGAQYENA